MAAHIECAAQRRGLEAQIAAQAEGYNAELTRLHGEIAKQEAARQPSETILRDTISSLKKEHNDHIIRMKAEHDIQGTQLRKEHEDRIIRMKTGHDVDVAQLKTEREQAITIYKTKTESLNSSLA